MPKEIKPKEWTKPYPGSTAGVGQISVFDAVNKVGYNITLENWGTPNNPTTVENIKASIEGFIKLLEATGNFNFQNANYSQNVEYSEVQSNLK